jgi:hypothetical protein
MSTLSRILVVCFAGPAARRPRNLDEHISKYVSEYFERIAQDHKPYLTVITVADYATADELRVFVREHQPDAIISCPPTSTLEDFAAQYNIHYLGCEPIAPESAYFDNFILSGKSTTPLLEQLPIANIQNTICLSKLSNESAFYSRFMPIQTNSAKKLYQHDSCLKILVTLDAIGKTDLDNKVTNQISEFLSTQIEPFTNKHTLILFSKSSATSKHLKRNLVARGYTSVHEVKDHFRLSENILYSLLQKSDIILSTSRSFGLDAIVLGKPTIFIGHDSSLFTQLNNLLCQPAKDKANLKEFAYKQAHHLKAFLRYAEKKHLIFPNHQHSAREIHHHFSLALNLHQGLQKHDIDFSDHTVVNCIEYANCPPIIPKYSDKHIKNKKIYAAYLRKRALLTRKYIKFQLDPHAFFRDSRFAIFRFLSHII